VSVYEDYDTTSVNYDNTRLPVGSEIILGYFAKHKKSLSKLEVLDAGCGTGSYAKAIAHRVGQISAVDISLGMLQRARAKLWQEEVAERIQFHENSVTELPFEDNSFDAAMVNQVAHHLGDTLETGFRQLRRLIGELSRVLRSGGRLVFNHCSQEQLRYAYWYYELIPKARDNFLQRYVPLSVLHGFFAEAGFINRDSFMPVDAVCQGKAYFHGRGPLTKTWRDGDSIWSLVDDQELAHALELVSAMEAGGELEAYVHKHDAPREKIGQVTLLGATRH
jgi:ubiquinone/menaquinone biosynthesis C-methylase UbiE